MDGPVAITKRRKLGRTGPRSQAEQQPRISDAGSPERKRATARLPDGSARSATFPTRAIKTQPRPLILCQLEPEGGKHPVAGSSLLLVVHARFGIQRAGLEASGSVGRLG